MRSSRGVPGQRSDAGLPFTVVTVEHRDAVADLQAQDPAKVASGFAAKDDFPVVAESLGNK